MKISRKLQKTFAMSSSRNFILRVSLRRSHSQNCANIAFCMTEISEKCFWNIIFVTGRYLRCYKQDNCWKIMIFVSMLFPKRSAWCLRFASNFFQLKKEASNKPVETINVKVLYVAVSSRLPSVIASSVWLIPEVRNYLKRLYLEEILEECENAAKYTRGHLPSVLRDKSFETMRDFSWEKILTEAKERCPNLLDVITAVCCRREGQNVQRSGAKRFLQLEQSMPCYWISITGNWILFNGSIQYYLLVVKLKQRFAFNWTQCMHHLPPPEDSKEGKDIIMIYLMRE